MVGIEPISNQDVVFFIGLREWNRDKFWGIDSNSTVSSGRFLE